MLVCVSMRLSPFISPSPSYPPPPRVHKSLFSKSPSPIAALQVGSSVRSFQVPYTRVNICYLFLHLASCTHHYSPRFIHVIAWVFSFFSFYEGIYLADEGRELSLQQQPSPDLLASLNLNSNQNSWYIFRHRWHLAECLSHRK